MRRFRQSGKTTLRVGATSHSHRYRRKTGRDFAYRRIQTWLTLFSGADEPRNLIPTDEPEAKRRQ